MNNRNTLRRTSKARALKSPKKSRVVYVSLFVACALIVAGIGTYAVLAIKKTQSQNSTVTSKSQPAKIVADKDNSSSQSIKSGTGASTNGIDSSTLITNGSSSTSSPTFSFVDSSQWVTKNSRDGSFSIKYIQSLVYATCPDLADNLMTVMAGPTDSNIDCGSLQEAVSVQPYKGQSGTTVLRTETMVAQTDDVWDRSGAAPVTVSLLGGQVAQRYDYSSIILGTNYHTIEYATVAGGKRYVAIDNWQVTKSPNTSVADFDTMIQKTWTFNLL